MKKSKNALHLFSRSSRKQFLKICTEIFRTSVQILADLHLLNPCHHLCRCSGWIKLTNQYRFWRKTQHGNRCSARFGLRRYEFHSRMRWNLSYFTKTLLYLLKLRTLYEKNQSRNFNLTRWERLKAALYLRLKKRKTIFWKILEIFEIFFSENVAQYQKM